jgi:hypothetical protein
MDETVDKIKNQDPTKSRRDKKKRKKERKKERKNTHLHD